MAIRYNLESPALCFMTCPIMQDLGRIAGFLANWRGIRELEAVQERSLRIQFFRIIHRTQNAERSRSVLFHTTSTQDERQYGQPQMGWLP